LFQALSRRADVWHSRCRGNLHVTNSFFEIVRRLSPTAFDGPGNFGIAFDASGDPYVASSAEGNIRKRSPAGGHLGVFASAGLDLPRDLVVSPGLSPAAIRARLDESTWQRYSLIA
jgi:hypothetical protein